MCFLMPNKDKSHNKNQPNKKSRISSPFGFLMIALCTSPWKGAWGVYGRTLIRTATVTLRLLCFYLRILSVGHWTLAFLQKPPKVHGCENLWKTQRTNLGRFLIWLLTRTYLFLARGTLPPIASPAVTILVRTGRLAKSIASHSSFRIRSSTLWDLEIRWQWCSI